jgi:hypothetical protein
MTVKTYGNTLVRVTGAKEWEAQDAAASWSDGGAIAKILASVANDLRAVVADNAVLAVSEYAKTGEAYLRPSGADIIIGIKFWNDKASLVQEFSLRQLISNSAKDVRLKLGIDPEAQAIVSNLAGIGNELSSLGKAPKPLAGSVPPPLPRIVTNGSKVPTQ